MGNFTHRQMFNLLCVSYLSSTLSYAFNLTEITVVTGELRIASLGCLKDFP